MRAAIYPAVRTVVAALKGGRRLHASSRKKIVTSFPDISQHKLVTTTVCAPSQHMGWMNGWRIEVHSHIDGWRNSCGLCDRSGPVNNNITQPFRSCGVYKRGQETLSGHRIQDLSTRQPFFSVYLSRPLQVATTAAFVINYALLV